MGTDRIAISFANWAEAHKAYIEAERRLAIAFRTTRHIGMQPPQALLDEVAALKAQSDRLLGIAEAELRGKQP